LEEQGKALILLVKMTTVANLLGKTWIIIVIPYKVVATSDRKLNLCCTWFVSANGDHTKAHSLYVFSKKKSVNTRLWWHDDIKG
jgi:hypothetical protein